MMNETTDSPSDEEDPDAANTTNQSQGLDLINFGDKHNMAQSHSGDPSEVMQQTSYNMAKQHQPLLHEIQSLVGRHYHLKTAILCTMTTATVGIRDKHNQHRPRTKYEIDQPVCFSGPESISGFFGLMKRHQGP